MRPFIFALLLAIGCLAVPVYSQSMEGGDGNGYKTPSTIRDSLLVGKWRIIESINHYGYRSAELFEIEYRRDGKAVFNRKALYKKFNERNMANGALPLSSSQLDRYFPKVSWKTDQDRIILTFKSRLGINDLTYHYKINGDTLTTVNALLAGTRSKLVAVRTTAEQ